MDAAGGLVIDSNNRVLFIFKDNKWDLPKGLVEDGRSPVQTALIETQEETGIPIDILEIKYELLPTHHISKYRKTRYIKRTQWYLIHCTKPFKDFTPQTEEGIVHCEWVPTWDLHKVFENCPDRISYLVRYWLKYTKTFS